ncbi:hypothetical protein ANN_14097 [Periplaneta americana]|uniref:Reverse transcriptase domain-containing protein n=1 Tax=Periplaneta americana TaxID=6978 RepID=A0ABQ8SVY6_PERAM|nr:hypothetical protein ANN_14097 [Periplaneta americana]
MLKELHIYSTSEDVRVTRGKDDEADEEQLQLEEEIFTSLYAASPTSQKATADILKSVNRHQDLQLPITEEEIRSALEGAPKNTAPGPDGLTYQVYKNHWRLVKEYLIELMNYILDTGSVIDGFSDGVVTLIPKTTNPTIVSEYRPITLLNINYKLFMKVLGNRLKPAFRNIFEIGQTCGVPEKSIIHNLATIRDTVLHFEEHHDDKGALLSVDFNKAFDRVNHLYLQRVMECLCILNKIISVIKNIYRTAHSRIQVNGFFTQRIPIQASVRQGCPLSMFLFALRVEPLICMAHQNLNSEQRTTCPLFTSRVYADDILFLLRDADDCVILPHILETYSAASYAQLNTRKSFLIPLGSWPDGLTFNEITTVRQAKMLGMAVCNSFEEMVEISWTKTTALTRVTLFQQIHRNLNLFERESTIGLTKDKGGLQLIAVKEKCQALITRNIIRGQRGESDPMDNEFWKRLIPLLCSRKSPLPQAIQSLWKIIESYPSDLITADTKQQTKLIYKYIMKNSIHSPRIVEQFPNQRWHKIWHNIHLANIPTAWQTTVYCYINQIIPTEQRKHRHHLTDSPACKTCGFIDTLKHRITNCGIAKTTWKGAKNLLQQIWPTSKQNDRHQTLLLMDPPTDNAVFVKAWLAAGFLHYQLSASSHTMEEFVKILTTERKNFEQKCSGRYSQNCQELQLLHL